MELILDLVPLWKQIMFILLLVVGFIFFLLLIYHYLLNIESMAHSLWPAPGLDDTRLS